MKEGKGNLKRDLLRFFLHPAILVIPLAVLVWALIPDIHQQYKSTLIRTLRQDKVNRHTYVDLNNDGFSEHFITGFNDGIIFCTIYNKSDKIYKQYNFRGKYPPAGFRSICGDINRDGIKELFIFSVVNDSIFINSVDPNANRHDFQKSRFLCKIADDKSWNLPKSLLHDLNGDKTDEIILLVTAGFQETPRQVFAYDIVNDTILASPDFGAYGYDMSIYHEKGKPRIAVSNYAPCNIDDTIGRMHDHSSYRIILDEKLQFRFPPKEEKGDYSNYYLTTFYHDGDTMLLSRIAVTNKEPDFRITLTDLNGNIKASSLFRYDKENFNSFEVCTDKKGNTKIIGTYNYDQVMLLDHNLDIIKKRNLKTEFIYNINPDVDNDGVQEVLFNSIVPYEFILIRDNLKHPVTIKTFNIGPVQSVSTILRGNKPPQFAIQINDVLYTFQYSVTNPLVEYLILAFIYLFIFGFTLLIRGIQRRQLKKKYETRQKISELKFLTIRNQMDPHFTFNILNTIGSIILQNRPEESYKMLMKYSKFLRTTLTSSDTLLGTLEAEVNFVTNYLELQKIRFREKLEYSINIEPGVDITSIVPKMVLYTYIENAIKHGISGLSEGGVIEISISRDQSHILIKVLDNGIGRKKAAQNRSDSTGKGHKIMNQLYKLLNETNKSSISEEILDHVDPEGNPAGTEVVIKIPVGMVMA